MKTLMTSTNKPVIRQRTVKSRRRKDGLIRFALDHTSQNGEDGIIARIFELLPFDETNKRYCVDVGAWDGQHLSNTYSLLVPSANKTEWSGVLIEADTQRFDELKALHEPLGNLCLNITISSTEDSSDGLVRVLKEKATGLPGNLDFLCIDVDGSDYWLLHDLLKDGIYSPKVVCIEFNPSMPDDLIYIPIRSDAIRHGASLSALVELAQENGYVLVETTLYNAFFVQGHLYQECLRNEVPDTSIEALHETTMGTNLYQLYDGTLKLWGCKKLLWHRVAMDETKLQVLPPQNRKFPFAPKDESASLKLQSLAVDMTAYCQQSTSKTSPNTPSSLDDKQSRCAQQLVERLATDGFCLIRGTGITQSLCEEAISVTNSFLHDADENVRRSCLTKDRARRGYSPMCTENFASLIGKTGPNDLVRKFRIGPRSPESDSSLTSLSPMAEQGEEKASNSSNSNSSPLLSPNIWPPAAVWSESSSSDFRSTLEDYYDKTCSAANAVVRAICDGIIKKEPRLASSMNILSMESGESLEHSTILTLLGYRQGTRHKKASGKKNKHIHPLVAAHTDVGVITMLLYDAGDCAVLQRKQHTKSAATTTPYTIDTNVDGADWTDVVLPHTIPVDPIFVVNIADCLSDLSNKHLPSTLHRVVPTQGTTPRNCLALFVGLNPKVELTIPGGCDGDDTMSYEEWRKRRIAAAQRVLKG